MIIQFKFERLIWYYNAEGSALSYVPSNDAELIEWVFKTAWSGFKYTLAPHQRGWAASMRVP